MAFFIFSDAQKVDIRNYLGRSELNKEIDPKLESIMNALSTDAGNKVVAILAKLAEVDTQIETVFQNNLDLTKAEDVMFAGEQQLESLRRMGRQYVNQMSTIMDVHPYRDVYDPEAIDPGGLVQLG